MKAPALRMAACAAFALAAGCRQNMVRQPRYDDYEAWPLTADGTDLQAPPDGTVAQDAADRARRARRPALTPALLARGQERHAIYCAPCHGADGRGGGIIPARGFPRPPSYLDARVMRLDPERVYRTISDGYGVMYGFADRVDPADRWAIAAYVRALQKAGGGDDH